MREDIAPPDVGVPGEDQRDGLPSIRLIEIAAERSDLGNINCLPRARDYHSIVERHRSRRDKPRITTKVLCADNRLNQKPQRLEKSGLETRVRQSINRGLGAIETIQRRRQS